MAKGLLLMGPEPPDDAESADDKGEVNAASAAIKAIKAGDATALSEALKLHYELCQMPAYEPEESE